MGFNIGQRLIAYLEPMYFIVPALYGSFDLGDLKAWY